MPHELTSCPTSRGDAMPLLTIITVVRNGGGGFERTRDSVLSQTNHSFQWIIKDGGSSDGTLEKALELKDDRITVIQGKDAGIYDAMNQATRNVSGQYVHFLNAGDFYASKDSIQQFSEAAKKSGFPSMVICFIKNQFAKTVVSCPKRPNRYYLYRRCYCHQAVFFDVSMIQRVGCYDISLNLKADHDLIMRCLKQGLSYIVIPEEWVCYDGGGITDNFKSMPRLDVETREIHRRHFSAMERILFGTIQETTLWRLRRMLASNNRSAFVVAYNHVVNIINRRF